MFSSNYFIAFVLSFLLSIFFTLIVKKLAIKYQIVDTPDQTRKIHSRPIPLLGGIAIFLSFFIVLGYFTFFTPHILSETLLLKHLAGVFLAALILVIGGFLDDRYNLPPLKQFIWPFLGAVIVIMCGVGVKHITNPLGGLFDLEIKKFFILKFGGVPYYFSFPADILTLFWLLGMVYTTKFLDGLDGLVTGITAIGGLIIFSLCLFTVFYQPEVAFLAAILTGACVGFLIFNFHPAKIFLGEGGSTFCGFMLGVLAIISGGKFATALMVVGIAILDALWVIIRRIFWERRSPFLGDNKHLHFRLLDIGFSQKQVVLFLYFLSSGFGLASLFLQSKEKLSALLILAVIMAILGLWVAVKGRNRRLEIKS